jgi:hypothetical protein
MRRVLAILLLISASVSGSNQETPSLNLGLKMISQDHCQFTSDTQGVTLHVKLTFSNSGEDDIPIQQIDGLTLTAVSKSLEDMYAGVYVISWEPERLDGEKPKNGAAIILRPGGSFETTDLVSLNVIRNSSVATHNFQLPAGSYYLQVGESLITGDASPRTWRSAVVRSKPVGFTVGYSDKPIAVCSRKD